ncbi:MAG: DUF6438 domain-containing protein [Bacteroidota bacterium]
MKPASEQSVFDPATAIFLVDVENEDVLCESPSSVFVLEKPGCYGVCPALRMELFSDRTLLFQGFQHTDRIGDYWTRLTTTEYQTFLLALAEVHAQNLASQYPVNGLLLPDLPQTYFSWELADEKQEVLANYEVPASLRSFEAWVLRFLGQEVWDPFS